MKMEVVKQFPATPKELYRRKYFEILDLAVMSITERFDQPGFKIYSKIEQLLFKACSGKEHDSELTAVCDFYGDDLSSSDLQSQLKILRTLYIEKKKDEKPSISGLKYVLQSLSLSQRELLDMVCRTFQLLIVMPATNCTSERSFSALRRIKSYLRSTMSQARLNHLMVLHYHQDMTDNLDLKTIVNYFISAKESRQNIFAKF